MKANEVLQNLPPLLRRRRTLLALAGLLGVVLLWWMFRPAGSSTATTAYYQVKRGDFTVSITEGGTLAAVSEISIRNEVEGTARIIYIAKEGSYVKKGDLLVELDSSQAQDQVNQQEINYEKATNALIAAQLTLDIQRSQTNSDIRAAKLKLDFAKLDQEKFELGQRNVDLIEASNKVFQAEGSLAMNLDSFINTTNLASKGYETKNKEDQDRLSLLSSRNSLVAATNSLFLLRTYDHKKLEAKYQSDVDEAEKELERVVATSERRIAQYVSDLLTQSNTLDLNARKLERDKKNLAACKIYAPQEGLVVYPMSDDMRFRSDAMVEEGATVRNRQELIKLPDISRMKVTVKVHESHVNMVRPDQPAFVVLDSMPDQPFRAHVEKVALLPDTTSRFGNPNLKVYNTEVHLDEELPDVKPGVSARAEIIITNIATSISVPIQAVTTLKGKQVCYRQSGGASKPVPVEVGLFNTRFIQIVSGLEEGDRVLLAPPFDAEQRDLEGSVLTAEERAKAAATNTVSARAATSTPDGRAPEGAPVSQRGPAVGPAGGPPFAGNPPATAPIGFGPGGGGGGNNGPAAGDPAANAAGGRRGGGQRGGFDLQAITKEFDKDGDGQLSEEEQQAMRDTMRQRFAAQGGPPGFDREAMTKEYDKDGDGQLNDEERQAMRDAMRQRFGGQGGPGGQGGQRGSGGGDRGSGGGREGSGRGGFGGDQGQGAGGESGAAPGVGGGEAQGGGGRRRPQAE